MRPVRSSVVTLFMGVKHSGWCDTISSAPNSAASAMTASVMSSATMTFVTGASSLPQRKPALSKLSCVSSGAFSQRKAKMSFTVVMISLLVFRLQRRSVFRNIKRLHVGSFQFQELQLFVHASSVASQAAVGAHDAVTWYDY